jgi:mono/diheme cytochrome c family protein
VGDEYDVRMRVAVVVLAVVGLVLVAWPRSSVIAGSSAKARGAALFSDKGCSHCHGVAGVGGDIGPDLQRVRKRLDKAAIAKQIHDGGKAMPAFGDELDDAQINDLVAYLRTKRKLVVTSASAADAVAPKRSDKDPD